jgi:hypothetical protein
LKKKEEEEEEEKEKADILTECPRGREMRKIK